jgi:NAD(P)-dependent dehydrogenase (short-subunit alcohol dehydrogenase family)
VTRLVGQLAVVTGASRGIGAATAERLAAEGAQVVRVARSLSAGSRDKVRDIPCDLTQPKQVARLGARITGELGTPDIVVSNAGAFLPASLEDTTPGDLERHLAVNVKAPFYVAATFLPAMRAAGKGSFITIGSLADHLGLSGNSAYAASKYGLRGLHETLLAEYRGSGVRLTLVSPGATDTGVWDPVGPDNREGFPRRADMLQPADVAEAILFVATRPPHVLIDWLRLGPTNTIGRG